MSWRVRFAIIAIFLATGTVAGQDVLALREAAASALDQKDYARCAAVYGPLGRSRQDAEILFSVASCLALSGKTDEAFLALDDMLDFQWPDAARLQDEPDLKTLRDDSRWPAITARAEVNWRAIFGETNRELAAMAASDQAERQAQPVDWKTLAEHDRDRRTRLHAIIATDSMRTSWDYCNAALIMQHGTDPSDYREAHELAICGVEIAPRGRGCRSLVPASFDRYLQSIGKPQIYGTQVRRVNGVWTLEPLDETAVTDEERAKWNLPPLAELKRRVAESNRQLTK